MSVIVYLARIYMYCIIRLLNSFYTEFILLREIQCSQAKVSWGSCDFSLQLSKVAIRRYHSVENIIHKNFITKSQHNYPQWSVCLVLWWLSPRDVTSWLLTFPVKSCSYIPPHQQPCTICLKAFFTFALTKSWSIPTATGTLSVLSILQRLTWGRRRFKGCVIHC